MSEGVDLIEQRIAALEKDFDDVLNSANSARELEALRIEYLGRKGNINAIFNEISKLDSNIKPEAGRLANAFKLKVTSMLDEKELLLKEKPAPAAEAIDITLPGHKFYIGSIHPITKTMQDICSIFTRSGFSIVEGPEIDTEYYNFEALNIPLEHPSRDAFDTFYIKTQNSKLKTQNLLLRSHTSPVQIHAMEKHNPPLAIIVPGKVYRPDAVDASHSFMFHQIEGLMIDKEVNFANLKGVLSLFVKEFFGKDANMRFRPHFFPFTEPSAELDISCIICSRGQKTEDIKQRTENRGQKKCSVCGGKGWLEILGCGMVHPNVFKKAGIDPDEWSGFAFGMGVERIAMLKYGIDDIRLFFESDVRFLRQF